MVMDADKIRNIGIIAHIDAGKTTFTERVLYYTKTIGRMGEVHDGSATMDFLSAERERGITIAAACTSSFWKGYQINLIDTPGHVDFSMEVERSLRVLDGAVGIFCGIAGVEPQSEQVWRQSERYKIPKLAVVNKMDREGADYDNVLLSMRKRLGINPLPITIPHGTGEDFKAIVDIVRQETVYFSMDDFGASFERKPWDDKVKGMAEPYRDNLINVLTEYDDELLEICLSGKEPDAKELDKVIRQGTLKKLFTPVFATAAFRNIGIQPVIEAICSYLPSPQDRPAVKGRLAGGDLIVDTKELNEIEIKASAEDPFCAFVFKKVLHKGKKTAFTRIYSGTLEKGNELIISRSHETFKAEKIFRVYASSYEEIPQVVAGDIVALEGVDANTGDTLVQDQPLWILDPVITCPTVISQVFEPKTEADGEGLDNALSYLCEEDPSLEVENKDGIRVVSGLGELHLDVVRHRLKDEFKVEARVGNPQVVMVETPKKDSGEIEAEICRKIGDEEIRGYIKLRVRPDVKSDQWAEEELAQVHFDDKFRLLSTASRGNIVAAILAVSESGPLGLPVRSLRVDILDLGLSSKENIFIVEDHSILPGLYMATQKAMEEALKVCGTHKLEPYMRLGVVVPPQHMGASTSLLTAIGAKITEIVDRGEMKQISAKVPMRRLFGFSTTLRSHTQGRASMNLQFDSYELYTNS